MTRAICSERTLVLAFGFDHHPHSAISKSSCLERPFSRPSSSNINIEFGLGNDRPNRTFLGVYLGAFRTAFDAPVHGRNRAGAGV
ncbi:hypothetical protein BS17DRAFT_788951 [Gyrodon lividus]|nr:hypothetical protein BS17DRAFT_788951 [Gyrodon lividus]